jgi:hypothetical protein
MWIAAGLAVIAAVVPLLFAAGGPNRISISVLPFGVAAAAMVANALSHRRSGWLAAILYTAAVLALLYGVILVLSVPLRLSIEGSCQPPPATCPLGFDRPLTSGESNGIYVAAISGGLALLFTFMAVELQFLRKPLLFNRPTTPTPSSATPAPTPAPRAATPPPASESPARSEAAAEESPTPPKADT